MIIGFRGGERGGQKTAGGNRWKIYAMFFHRNGHLDPIWQILAADQWINIKHPMFHGVLCVTNSGNWGTEIDCQYTFFEACIICVRSCVFFAISSHIQPAHLVRGITSQVSIFWKSANQTKVSMNERKVEMNVAYIFAFVSEGCFAKWIPKKTREKNRTAWCVLNVQGSRSQTRLHN